MPKPINLPLTRKEYRALLDVLAIADWVMHAHKTKPGAETKVYRDLEQKLLSFSREMGCEDVVEYAPDMKQYFPTRVHEENSVATQFIKEFENDSFWDELRTRLAERDLLLREGAAKVERMSFEERLKKTEVLETIYGDEFADHGLDHLVIKSPVHARN